MTEKNPTWIDGVQVSGQELRLALAGLWTPNNAAGATPAARSGVRASLGDLLVSANGTPNMSVNVNAGQCFVLGTETSNMGGAVGTNDATKNLVIAAADATNPRLDLIVARWYSETVAVGSRKFALEVVTGSPAASPVDPTVPANSLVLARISVAAAVTSITSGAIADLRVFTVALGGTTPCLSTARPSSPYSGMAAYETDTGKVVFSDGAGWSYSGRFGGPLGNIGNSSGPAVLTDYSTLTAVLTLSLPVKAGRFYRVSGKFSAVQQAVTGNALVYIDCPADSQQMWLKSTAAGETAYGSGMLLYLPGADGTAAFHLGASSSAGALRFNADSAKLVVEDIGT